MTHPAHPLLAPHLGAELARSVVTEQASSCPRQRLVDALATIHGVRGVALMRPAPHGEGTALVQLRGHGLQAADLAPLCAWAARPDAWLADRLLRHIARDRGVARVSETLPAAAVQALSASGLEHAVGIPLARSRAGRPAELTDWLVLGTRSDATARLTALFEDLRPALSLLLTSARARRLSEPLSLLFRAPDRLVQATGPVPEDLDRLREALSAPRDPRLPGQGVVASPVDAVARLTRLDRLDGSDPHWLVHLEPAPIATLAPHHGLTARQREVAELAACGVRNKEIASHLGISPATVKVHLRATYEVLGVGSRAELGQHGEALARPLDP